VDLAVAHDHKDPAVATLHSRRQRHADADRKAVAERPGRGLDAGDLAVLRVPAENRALATKGGKFAYREIAFVGQDSVKGEPAVALAQGAAIAQWPFRLLRAMP